MTNRRFLIASGGTGGHFYPGFSLGKQLQNEGSEVLFVVRRKDAAIPVLQQNHLPYREIDCIGFPRSINPKRQFHFFRQFYHALCQTRQIIREFRPDVIVGTGGYISFPLVFVGHFCSIKTAVHDSNARLGLANALCSRFSDVLLLGLPLAGKTRMERRSELIGTPIRPEFASPIKREEIFHSLGLSAGKPTVLVMGGSQGAKNLNNAVIELAKQYPSWQFIHLTGPRWYQTVKEAYSNLPQVAVLAYSHEVYNLMKVADLMICRSGASTLAELFACRLPAILVPFPHAAGNHQYFNAKIFEQAGCGRIVLDNEQLQIALHNVFEETAPKTAALRQSYEQLHLPDPLTAAERIATRLREL